MFVFDSRNPIYKSPFGAVATGENVNIVFPVEKRHRPKGVFMVLRGALDVRIELDRQREDGDYVFYATTFSVASAGIAYYRFEIKTDGGFLFVGRDALGKAVIRDWLPEWQLTVYKEGYTTPDWLKGGLIYHIFADRFARVEDGKKPLYGYLKDLDRDVEVHKEDGSYAANDFFGGNIKGIISKLDYIEGLGVNAIYLSPVFESSSNHRYDTADYNKIDYLFGDEEEFISLISECKARGIGVILDGVFNHTGADSIYFNKFGHYPNRGAYNSKNSRYFDWFTFYNYPEGYQCWWGVKSVPSIRRNSEDYQKFIAGFGGIIDKWTSLGVMGWRLDVVDELSSDFTKRIRQAIKRHGGERAVIGEVWEDASTKISYSEKREYLLGEELDGVMNYPFRTAILDYVKTTDAEVFAAKVWDIMENYPKQALDCCMTLIGTHDTVRAINELSVAVPPNTKAARKTHRLSPEEYAKAKKRLMIAAALQYFLPGVPTVYYGDETALQGFEDPMNRRPYPWGSEDNEVIDFYKKLGAVRKSDRASFSASAKVEAVGSAVKITRGRYTLYANSAAIPLGVEEGLDLLSGNHINSIPACGAAIFVSR